MNMSFRFICLGAAALTLSACSLPNYSEPKAATLNAAPKATATAPAKAPAQAKTTASQQADVEVEEPAKPTNPWAHQPSGANDPFQDGGDEDSGWG